MSSIQPAYSGLGSPVSPVPSSPSTTTSGRQAWRTSKPLSWAMGTAGFSGQAKVKARRTLVGPDRPGQQQEHQGACVVQVSGQGHGVSAVVAGSGQQQHPLSGRFACGFGQCVQGLAASVFHEQLGAQSEFVCGLGVPGVHLSRGRQGGQQGAGHQGASSTTTAAATSRPWVIVR